MENLSVVNLKVGEKLVEKVGEGTAELEKRRVDWVK